MVGPGTGSSKHKRSKRASKLRQLLEELPSQSQFHELEVSSDDDSMRHRMRSSRYHPANLRLKNRNSVQAHNILRRLVVILILVFYVKGWEECNKNEQDAFGLTCWTFLDDIALGISINGGTFLISLPSRWQLTCILCLR
jgi:hypothetical protein